MFIINIDVNYLGANHVPHQLIHSDVNPLDASLRMPHMFIGIVGLEAESFIRLLRYSHTHYKNNKKKNQKSFIPLRLASRPQPYMSILGRLLLWDVVIGCCYGIL